MVVATFILAIVIISVMGAFASLTQANSKAQFMQTAALLAEKKISEMEMKATSLSGGDQQGDFGEEYPTYRWKQSVESTDYPKLFKVSMTIQWGSGNPSEQRLFTSYIRTDENDTDAQIKLQQQQQQSSSGASGGSGASGP